VPDSQGIVLLAPTAADGVKIAGANTAALNLDVDIVVAERLRLELVLVKLKPGLRSVDLESSELLGDRHSGADRKAARAWGMRFRFSRDNVRFTRSSEREVQGRMR
jgi:hypothetical protein